MKNFILAIAFIMSKSMISQITLNHTHDDTRYLTKLGHGGYVYYSINAVTETIDLFDVATNGLIKAMAVPNFTTAILDEIHLSDNLFDTDLLVEFVVIRSFPGGKYNLEIYNELGTLVFSLTNCLNLWTNNGSPLHIPILKNDHLVYYDGISTKMQVYRFTSPNVGTFQVYDLPGSLPCVLCSTEGQSVSLNTNEVKKTEANFFPNPIKGDERLKLKYNIPAATKNARVKVYDMSGKLMDDIRVSSVTDYILLPTSYNNGFYLYSLEIDGKVIKSEKIILDK